MTGHAKECIYDLHDVAVGCIPSPLICGPARPSSRQRQHKVCQMNLGDDWLCLSLASSKRLWYRNVRIIGWLNMVPEGHMTRCCCSTMSNVGVMHLVADDQPKRSIEEPLNHGPGRPWFYTRVWTPPGK
ncbi:hypothetical protein LY76DRAFT_588976 [Colletotrichum caudatum]|nr:hypothetical protein LY76DRAFT_588976 [Colletotrichum caudatum]